MLSTIRDELEKICLGRLVWIAQNVVISMEEMWRDVLTSPMANRRISGGSAQVSWESSRYKLPSTVVESKFFLLKHSCIEHYEVGYRFQPSYRVLGLYTF